MLLTNGRIYTLDARGMIADTLVVRDGLVAFAGRRAEVNAPPGEDIVDLGGRAALPGLVDAHGHLMHLARGRLTLDLRGVGSEEAAARRVGERAARLPRGEWISGRNWDQNLWPSARFPSKATLDRVAPDHPVALVRGGFPFRNYVAVAGRSKSTWEHYREHGPERLGDGRLAIGALKLMADGALGSRGAALHGPYCDDPGNTGLVLMDARSRAANP